MLNRDHLAEARAAARDAFARVAKAIEAHLERSTRYLAERRFEEAAAVARHALALAPLDLRARRVLALALAAGEAQNQLLTRLGRRAESEATNTHGLAARGEALLREGNLSGAERMLRSALRRAPGEERCSMMLADVLNRQGRGEEAIRLLRELIAVPTRDPHVQARLGQILMQDGKLGEAELAFRNAADMDPGVDGFRSLLAEVLHRQGRNVEAAAILQDIVARPTDDPHTHARYGRVLVQLGDLAGAEAAMRAATALQPDGDGFHNALADVLNRRGERAEALRILQQLVAKPTRDPHIHAHLGHVLAQDGDLVGAEAAFCRAAAIDPGIDGFRCAQADILHRQGRHADAIAMLQDLVARPTRDPHIHARYGTMLAQAGDLAGAEAAIRTATEIEPGVDGFQNSLADVLNRRGDRAAALKILRRLVEKPTPNPHIHAHLGHVLAQDGDLAGAEAAFCRAAEMDPGIDGFRSAQADAVYRQGRHADAIAMLRDLVARPTRDPHIHARYATLLVQAGDLGGAETAIRTATAMDPAVDGFQNTLADVLNRRGECASAIKILQHLVGKPTRDAHIHAHLGRLLAQEGDLVGAEAAFCRAADIDPTVDGFRGAQADILDRQGRHDAALAILRDLAAKPTRDPHIHSRYGHVLLRMGNLAAAETAFRTAVALAPDAEAFRRGVADVLARRGRYHEALGILLELVASPDGTAHCCAQLGRLLLQHGDLAEAEQALREAIERDRNVAGFHAALTDVLEQQGRRAEAICVLQEAGRSLSDAAIHARLGRMLAEERDFTGAAAAWRHAIELAPEDVDFATALEKVTAQLAAGQPPASAASTEVAPMEHPFQGAEQRGWRLLRFALGRDDE